MLFLIRIDAALRIHACPDSLKAAFVFAYKDTDKDRRLYALAEQM